MYTLKSEPTALLNIGNFSESDNTCRSWIVMTKIHMLALGGLQIKKMAVRILQQ